MYLQKINNVGLDKQLLKKYSNKLQLHFDHSFVVNINKWIESRNTINGPYSRLCVRNKVRNVKVSRLNVNIYT